MTKTTIPYATDDVSALARHLSKALAARTEPPGHVEMLNILAQATGARNFQHFRAQAVSASRLNEPAATAVSTMSLSCACAIDGAATANMAPATSMDSLRISWSSEISVSNCV